MKNAPIYSVTQVNQYIKGLLDRDGALAGLFVRGELSNYKAYPSGHHYFSLKDAEGAIRCVMFRREAMGLRFRPENELLSHCGCNFIHIHTETSVSGNINDLFLRASDLCTDCSAKTISHCSKTAGCQKCSRFFVFVILCRPHLMLSYFRHNDGIPVCLSIDFLNDIRT